MNNLLEEYGISKESFELVNKCEKLLMNEYQKIDNISLLYSLKILNAFKKENLSETDFYGTTGYGYNDVGREKIEKIFANVLGGEDALVRSQFISGSHALTVALFAMLRPNDLLLSISGTPYDTLHEIIGIRDNPSSLKSYGINYDQIDLINDDFDVEGILNYLKNHQVKLIEIQRSRGYSTRKALSINKIANIIKKIREVNNDVIIMVDNCYTEFVEEKTPLEVGADIIVGSLIKNLGGAIANNGGYIVGKKNLIDLCADRLNVPGQGKEVGPSLGSNKSILMGLYHAPFVVASSVKTAVLTSKVMEEKGYDVEPKWNDERVDIVQTIKLGNEKDLVNYITGIQTASAIDSNAITLPVDMPGYKDRIVMASGSFTQGSSIEISCDGPIREPYIAYQQGSVTYEYGKLAVMRAVSKL